MNTNYIDSLALFEENGYFVSSTAALRALSHCEGPVRHLQYLTIVPRPLRDVVYRFIAKHRYRWFGRREQCLIPTPELKERFLSD